MNGVPDDEVVEQLMFYRVDIGDTHQVGTRVTDDDYVSGYIQSPTSVQAVIRS